MYNFELKYSELISLLTLKGIIEIVSIVFLSKLACSILCSAVGGINFRPTRNLEANLQVSLFKEIFSAYSEPV